MWSIHYSRFVTNAALLAERVERRLGEMRGARAEDWKALSREVYVEIKPWRAAERSRLLTSLWRSRCPGGGAVVCYVGRRFAKEYGAADFLRFEQWIDRYVRNWGHCDGVSSWLVAACIANEPELRHKLRAWTGSRNRWKRRASAVSLVWEAKRGRHTETIFEIADALLDDRDDMVEKAVGWLLKETYPRRPAETVAFLLPRRGRASRTTLRYAAEKMTAADRAEVVRRPSEN